MAKYISAMIVTKLIALIGGQGTTSFFLITKGKYSIGKEIRKADYYKEENKNHPQFYYQK